MVADGKGLIGHAGAVLLRRLADRTGLTVALAAVLPAGTGTGWRDRAAVVVQLAIAIVLRAVNLSDAEQLQAHHQGLFGPAVSDSTTRRTLEAMEEEVLAKIARARAQVRRGVWSLLHLRPGGFPWLTIAGKRLHRWVVIDMDATIITAAAEPLNCRRSAQVAAEADAMPPEHIAADIRLLRNGQRAGLRSAFFHHSDGSPCHQTMPLLSGSAPSIMPPGGSPNSASRIWPTTQLTGKSSSIRRRRPIVSSSHQP
ncbi:hypothetical protein ACIOC2_27975 [Streptomyces sp. NPDC088337]|uniref:hypothetical protein n=1 Tax=unclassified Streptomyces TaxID=2593676 RepID=UPI00381C19DA